VPRPGPPARGTLGLQAKAAASTRDARNALAEQESRSRAAAILPRNDQGSLVTVRRDYRNDRGAGVSTEDSSDRLLAPRGAPGFCTQEVGICDQVKAGFEHPDRPPWTSAQPWASATRTRYPRMGGVLETRQRCVRVSIARAAATQWALTACAESAAHQLDERVSSEARPADPPQVSYVAQMPEGKRQAPALSVTRIWMAAVERASLNSGTNTKACSS